MFFKIDFPEQKVRNCLLVTHGMPKPFKSINRVRIFIPSTRRERQKFNPVGLTSLQHLIRTISGANPSQNLLGERYSWTLSYIWQSLSQLWLLVISLEAQGYLKIHKEPSEMRKKGNIFIWNWKKSVFECELMPSINSALRPLSAGLMDLWIYAILYWLCSFNDWKEEEESDKGACRSMHGTQFCALAAKWILWVWVSLTFALEHRLHGIFVTLFLE